jgi:hypothetical protein
MHQIFSRAFLPIFTYIFGFQSPSVLYASYSSWDGYGGKQEDFNNVGCFLPVYFTSLHVSRNALQAVDFNNRHSNLLNYQIHAPYQ